jgi:hypothetical protein
MNTEIRIVSSSSVIRLQNLKRRNTAPSGSLLQHPVDFKKVDTSTVDYRKMATTRKKPNFTQLVENPLCL